MYKIFMGQAVGSMEVTDMDKEKALEIILANACCTSVSYTHLSACINCGRCVEACPSRLVPTLLSTYSEHYDMEAFEK